MVCFFGRTQQLFGPPVGPEIGPVVRRHRPQRRPQRRHCGACYRVLPSFNGVFFSLIQSGFIQFQETSNALLSLNCISIDLLPQPTTNDSDIPFRVVVFLYRVVLTSFRLDSLPWNRFEAPFDLVKMRALVWSRCYFFFRFETNIREPTRSNPVQCDRTQEN